MKLIGEYYTVDEVASLTGIKYKTLLQRIARGKIEHEDINRVKLVPSHEVERLKKEQGQAK